MHLLVSSDHICDAAHAGLGPLDDRRIAFCLPLYTVRKSLRKMEGTDNSGSGSTLFMGNWPFPNKKGLIRIIHRRRFFMHDFKSVAEALLCIIVTSPR